MGLAQEVMKGWGGVVWWVCLDVHRIYSICVEGERQCQCQKKTWSQNAGILARPGMKVASDWMCATERQVEGMERLG